MKVDKSAVIEIALGVLIAGTILMVLSGLFGGWIASHGVTITGKKTDGSDHKFEEEEA